MQTPSIPNKYIPLRSPTPPLDSSSEDLNDVSLDQELARLDDITTETKRPHFLDYESIPPPDFDLKQNQSLHSLPYNSNGIVINHVNASNIPHKMLRNTEKISPNSEQNVAGGCIKKHFLDENPIPPDYDYERQHRSLDREYDRKGKIDSYKLKYERRHSMERAKQKKIKEPSYAMSRFLDDFPNCDDIDVDENDLINSYASEGLGKVECVYSLLSMIGCTDPIEMSSKFLEMSRSANTCATLRRSRCMPILVQMIHCETDDLTKRQARIALHNIVNNHLDDKSSRREAKVLKLIEQIMDYCESLKKRQDNGECSTPLTSSDNHPLQAMSSLMKISFDEEHRHAMCQLGALQTIACLVHYDHAVHGTNTKDQKCILLRRYAGMALTNLTFGDGNNKALLCSNKEFMKALVAQIGSGADDLLQVTANVLRNLSWRADNPMKSVLNEIGTVTALTTAAMKNKNENTLRAILSALWNLSAHCSRNKEELCYVDGALSFLVDMLTYDAPSKTLSIVENAGGILRNVSSHIAVNEDFRKILRQQNCLGILLQQLKSESLTIVSNSCGTLWNLSARCPEDQKFLWDNGAVPMLRSLIHSKHKMISNGSKAALKNLVNFRPGELNRTNLDPVAKMIGLKELPTLNVRKQRALEQELDQNLSETYENIEVKTPPGNNGKSISDFIAMEKSNESINRGLSHSSVHIRVMSGGGNGSNSSSKEKISSKIIYDNMRTNLPNEQQNDKKTNSATATIPIEENADSDNDQLSNISNASNNSNPSASSSVSKSSKTKNKGASKHPEMDSDQITNFSLLYDENHHEAIDVSEVKLKNKPETYTVSKDTVKCYKVEEEDLRASQHPIPSTPLRDNKCGRITNENSGINTPEKPIYYCEEGTPGYFSIHESFNSLDLECDDANNGRKPEKMENNTNNDDEHETLEVIEPVQPDQHENTDDCAAHNDKQSDTVPTSPGEATSKSVKFNEFLETPMMFSRQSSIESLTSLEPEMTDDHGSVISDISRMPSGIISPSELPDSPSQTMPPTPRRIRATSPPPPAFEDEVKTFDVENTPALISTATSLSNLSLEDEPKISTDCLRKDTIPILYEDEVKTFHVQNTPALISCATSLSNLSLDDETKITTDCLIKEMRLMHHLSDEQDDTAIASTSNAFLTLVNVDERRLSDNAKEETDNVPPNAVDDLSDSENSVEDSMVLASCINIGMKGGVVKANEIEKVAFPLFPKPNCYRHENHSSSDEDDNADTDILLQKCIRDGIQFHKNSITASVGSTTAPIEQPMPMPRGQVHKEHPIRMFRNGGNAYIEPMMIDETNRFHYEECASNYSAASGLSNLTVGSNTVGLLDTKRASNIHCGNDTELIATIDENRSLSPTSADSEEDRQLLNQTIAAGFTIVTAQLPANAISQKVQLISEPNYIESNDSISSIDSIDCNEDLLQQCIQIGMRKELPINDVPKNSFAHANHARRSQLPTFKPSAQQHQHHDRFKKRERQDEQHLLDCITTGVERNLRINTENTPPSLPPRNAHSHGTTSFRFGNDTGQRTNEPLHMVSSSKNDHTTSATVLVIAGATNIVPDVVMAHQEGTKVLEQDQHQLVQILPAPIMISNNEVDQNRHTNIGICEQQAQVEIGCNIATTLNASIVSTKSHNSFNLGNDSAMLEQSNEYPAQLNRSEYISDSENSSSIDMEVSNEFLFENSGGQKMDKHKDPDLMMQSVERFTHELMSTAEYLRTANNFDDDNTFTENNKKSSASNNTWNEDTHPNEISFPSISRTAPLIVSMNDDDTTLSENLSGLKNELIGEPTPTNENKTIVDDLLLNGNSFQSNGLHFDIGGEINRTTFSDLMPNFVHSGANSCDTNSTMTNSTIITMEANKIRTGLLNIDDDTTDSMISLDKIRPPSAMEKLQFSSYAEPLSNGPSSLKAPGKMLTQGFMARRALNNNNNNNNSAHGSMDSINSSCNLDKIKPPSLMDELLDSMISVDSIASEFVDAFAPAEDPSHYETAHSECDEMTTTLKSCTELPYDNTPCGSDFSSVESTPKKSKRTLTPRRKRQLTKDRYQTYTIASDSNQYDSDTLMDEPLQNGDDHFFRMEVSNHKLLINDDSDAISLVSTDDGEMSSIRALTKKLTYLHDINTNTYTRKSIEIHNERRNYLPTIDTDCNLNEPVNENQSQSPPPGGNQIKSPRIVKPNEINKDLCATDTTNTKEETSQPIAIRGRKKATYVSPYKMTQLSKPTSKPTSPSTTKPISPATTKVPVTSKIVACKSASVKATEAKPKSLIQRSAESLRKIRPSFASKLTKQNSAVKKTIGSSQESVKYDRQNSCDSTKSTETLIRQNTFTKDEPSGSQIPVISSEPSSPKKSTKIASKIPFTKSASIQRNVTKCKTNIEIPLHKNTINVKRNMKSATSASHITSPSPIVSAKQNSKIEQKANNGESTGRGLFKRFSYNAAINKTKAPSRELSGQNQKTTEIKASMSPTTSIPVKQSKVVTSRISTAAK